MHSPKARSEKGPSQIPHTIQTYVSSKPDPRLKNPRGRPRKGAIVFKRIKGVMGRPRKSSVASNGNKVKNQNEVIPIARIENKHSETGHETLVKFHPPNPRQEVTSKYGLSV